MPVELIALLSGMGWATEAILVRKGGQYAPVSLAVLIGFSVSVVVLWAINWWFFPLDLLYSRATLYFILGGVIQPGIVRLLHYTGIVRLGASRAGPVRAVAPLFAIAVAFIFLGERPEIAVYAGAVLCVAGLWFVSYRREGELAWRTIDLVFPLGAAFLTAVSQSIRKTGLLLLPNPFLAAAVTTTTALVTFLVTQAFMGQLRLIRVDKRCLPFYGIASVVSTVSQLLAFTALSMGDVSVVVPLVNTNPVFIVIFSAFFLKDLEKINNLVVTGAVLVVSGIAVITAR